MKNHQKQPHFQDGEDEENFFVSLSDLMTGVLFIFVILTTALALHYHLKAGELEKAKEATLAAQREANTAKTEAKVAREDAQQVQQALDALASVLREREQLRKLELEQLVARLREQDLAVDLDGTNGILSLPENLLFRTAEAKLRPDGEAALVLLAGEILPVALKGCGNSPLKWEAIYIEGHTDNIPIKTAEFASNWQLASARAISTFNALTVSQPALATLRNHQSKAVFGISGYGEQRPVAENSTEEGRRKNRRIDIRFVMAYPSESEIQKMEQQLKQANQALGGAGK